MLLPGNIIANADDFGLNTAVNKGILHCFENGYINSTSIMTNRLNFEEAIDMVHANKVITNVGLHVDFVNFKPASDFRDKRFLANSGIWDQKKTDNVFNFFGSQTKRYFSDEIEAQIQKVLKNGVKLTHMDTHRHLHILPPYFKIFIKIAKQYNLKLRLAQSFNEGNYLKFVYRKFVNNEIKKAGCNYADSFETVGYFLAHTYDLNSASTTEIMLHPIMNESGGLTDHYSATDIAGWISWLKKFNKV
ncbi:MAG: chitin disaccharide deacetylase [Mucilaginibacter sp.]